MTVVDALNEYYTVCHNRMMNPLPEGEYGEVHHILGERYPRLEYEELLNERNKIYYETHRD